MSRFKQTNKRMVIFPPPVLSEKKTTPYITVAQAAKLSGISIKTLISAIIAKTLPAENSVPPWMVTMDAVNTWMAIPANTSITRAVFVARFTNAEQVAIAGSPQALVWWLNLMDAPQINLLDSEIKTDLNALILLGMLTSARVTQILTL